MSLLSNRLEEELRNDLERGTIVWNELGTVNRAVYARRLGVTRRALPPLVLQAYDDLGPRKVSTESLLRSALDEDFQNGNLVFSKPGFIDKRHYGSQVSCSNTQYYKELFDEYEAKAGVVRTSAALLELLSRDFDAGTLRFSRGGKIDRTSYAIQLGVTKSNLTPHIAVFQRFEERLSGTGRYREDDLEKMARWLETNFQSGLLRFTKSGKLVRTQFKDAFGITHSNFETRFPAVGSLIQQYDALQQQRLREAGPRLGAAEPRIAARHTSAKAGASPGDETRSARRRAATPSAQSTAPDEASSALLSPDIIAAIDVAVSRVMARGALRHMPDGSIDRSYYVGQAVPLVSSTVGQVFDKYSVEVASDRERLDPESSDIKIPMEPLVRGHRQPSADAGQTIKDAIVQNVTPSTELVSPLEHEPTDEGPEDLTGPLLVYYPTLKRHQNYDPGTPSARVVSTLNGLVLGPGLPRSQDCTINRAILAGLLGIRSSELVPFDTIFMDYDIATRPFSADDAAHNRDADTQSTDPMLAAHQAYLPSSAYGRAAAVLGALLRGKGLPRHADGSLNRDALAQALRINPRALPTYQFMIDDYDRLDRTRALVDAVETGHPQRNPGKGDVRSATVSSRLASQPRSRAFKKFSTGPEDETKQSEESIERLPDETAAPSGPPCVPAAVTPEANPPISKHVALRQHQFHDAGSKRKRLDEILNQRLDHNPSARLVQIESTDALDVADATVGATYLETVDDRRDRANGNLQGSSGSTNADLIASYPDIEKHQYYCSDSTRGRLVAMLNQDLASGTIPRSRGGKIDRRALCAKLGFAHSAMNHYRAILYDYESATGGLLNVHARRIPEMDAFLSRSFHQGTLAVRDGKVERRQFYRHFGLAENKTILVRNPDILLLLERYDDLIKSTGYLPNATRQEIEVLKTLLEDDPPIFKTGMSLDRTNISRISKISMGRLVRSPFKDVLEEADMRLVQRIESDELCRVFAGRLFTFRPLLEAGWSHQFLKRISDGFQKIYAAKSPGKTKEAYNILKEILRFIANFGHPSCRAVLSSLNTGTVRSVRSKDWTLATQAFSTWIDDRDDLNGGTPKTKLAAANSVLRHLGNAGVLPELELALRPKGEASSHRRTLAQGPSKDGVDDYLAFATEMLHEAAKLRQIEIDTDEEIGFLQTLRTELAGAELGANDTPAEVIKRVLKRRLEAIQDALAGVYTRWRRHWERGQELLQAGTSLADGWEKTFIAGSRNEYLRRTEMRAFFPLDDPDRAVGNLIRLVADKLKGFYPTNSAEGAPFGQFFAKRALEFGGAINLQAMIMPHPHAIYAVILLYLCSSGANVAVARTLFVDAMEKSQITGATHLTGEKARARGKPIHAHLDDRSHAVMGITWLLEASSRVRESLEPDDRNLLFVVDERSGPKPVEEYAIRDFLKRIVADIPEIAELGVTPAMLRPTVLLIAALEGDANAHTTASLGQHGLNVGRGYIDHPPTRHMHDESIRGFVDSMQIASFHAEQDVTEWLGYTKADIDAKIDDLMETGLGTFCRDLYGRPGNDGGKCKTFDCWNSCPQLVVVARKKDLAFLIIWRASLIEAEAEWILERKERWYALWFPWLEFIKTVERKILLTAMGKIWREATVLATEIMAHPNFKPRRPY